MLTQPLRKNAEGVVLAAGYATRMGPLSDCKVNIHAATKGAFPVGIRSLIRQQLYMLHLMGIKKATVVVKFKPDSVINAIGDTSKFTLKHAVFDMNKEGTEDWGSAWTVYKWLSSQRTKPENLVVLNGDILWDKREAAPFICSFNRSNALAQIMASEMPMAGIFGRFGMVGLADDYIRAAQDIYFGECRASYKEPNRRAVAKLIYEYWLHERYQTLRTKGPLVGSFAEKPEADEYFYHWGPLANVGVFAFRPEVFDHYAPGACNGRSLGRDFSDLSRHLLREGMLADKLPVAAHMAPENFYWKDVGTPRDLMQVNRDIMQKLIDAGPQGREIKPGVWIGENVQISDWALEHIEGPVIIGDDVVITGKVKIGKNVLINRGWRIEDGVALDNCILLPSYYPADILRVIEAGARISHCIVAGGRVPKGQAFHDGIMVVSPDETMAFYPYDFKGRGRE